MATQAHPEYKSRPTNPHPLFAGMIGAALGESAGEDANENSAPREFAESAAQG